MRAFLTDWLAWAEAGGQGPRFMNHCGLCANAVKYDVHYELRKLFREQGLNPNTPFGTPDQYRADTFAHAMHLNPARLAWVRKTLETLP